MEMINDGSVRPTRIQHLSNMSYDRLKKHLLELDKSDLIHMNDGAMVITDKGREFLRNYDQLTTVMHAIGLD
jgi:predicted transcriptional regulator